MTTYKNTIRLFIRTMSVSIPYLLLLAAENVFLFRLLHAFAGAATEEVQAIYFLMDMNYLYVLGFLFFLFISCEIYAKKQGGKFGGIHAGESVDRGRKSVCGAWNINSDLCTCIFDLCTGGCFYFAYACRCVFYRC